VVLFNVWQGMILLSWPLEISLTMLEQGMLFDLLVLNAAMHLKPNLVYSFDFGRKLDGQ